MMPAASPKGGAFAADPEGFRELLHVPEAEGEPAASVPAVAEAGPLSLLNFVAQAVTDPNIDVAKLEVLLRMQREIVADEARVLFNEALARLSADLPRVKKNGRVDLGAGKGGYDFATWPDMDAVLRPLMKREGFTLSFDMGQKEGGGAVVSGTLLHIKGHSRTVSLPLALDAGAGRNNLQAMGSTLSYGKRYCAEMLFNIVREDQDDDGVRGGMAFLDEAQRQQVTTLLRETRADLDGFLDFVGAGSVEGIQSKDFGRAMNALTAKKRQMAAQAAGA